MSGPWRSPRAWIVWTLLLLLAGCGGGGGGGGSPTASASTQELAFLFQNNARFNNGLTVRWPTLPVQVHTAGIAGAESEVQSWTGATGGAVTFTFMGSPPAEGITFMPNAAGSDICGLSVVQFDSGGRILSARAGGSTMYRIEFVYRPRGG
ncbi:MAG: hypothetical protein HYV61_03945 [Candidatus Rokubacteria bacterium]|nr:hypothetical protein [Candidatus Rokubacteria bacterium]